MPRRRVPDEALLEAYGRLRNLHKVAAELDLPSAKVHERLIDLGAMQPVPDFTKAERERIEREYPIYRAHGRVGQLAEELGRTAATLSRIAGQYGLTGHASPPRRAVQWQHMSQSAARILFDDFRNSRLTLGQWCAKAAYDQAGFRATMQRFWPDEWRQVIESKTPKSSKYALGRSVEYQVRDRLRADGYFTVRAAASKGLIDLVAIKTGQVLFVQCKRGGSLPPAEWNALFDAATSCDAVPVLAERPGPRMLRFWELTARKDGSKRRQPMKPLAIDVDDSPAAEVAG